jgi:hypothetical protein
MVAITAADVADVMDIKKSDDPPAKNSTRQLVKFASDGSPTWGGSRPDPGPNLISWEELWKELLGFGRDNWGSSHLIRVPRAVARKLEESSRGADVVLTYRPEDVMRFLREVDSVTANIENNEPFVNLEPDGNGGYRNSEAGDRNSEDGDPIVGGPTERDDKSGESNSHRLLVFLDAKYLT